MSSAFQSVLDDWSLPIFVTSAILVTAVIYVRGWFALRATRREQFPGWRLASFLLGLTCLWAAIGSPLDAFADVLLSAHMVEHLILMSFVPPLLLIGLPVVPLLRGLPHPIRKYVAAPLIRLRPLRRLVHWFTTPLIAWLSMNLSFILWHLPAAYDFALEHEGWHDFEHICFLFTSLLFWWCVLRPWPAQRPPHSWAVLLYLISADIVNTILSAFLAFCNRAVYPFYTDHPNPFQIAPLPDQVLGAVIMWVIGSTIFLVPAAVITFGMLQPTTSRTAFTRA